MIADTLGEGANANRSVGCSQSDLGERIRSIRGNRSRDEFGAAVGVSRNTLMRYERGLRSPDSEFLRRLCENYRVRPAWLLSGEGLPYRLTQTQRCVVERFSTYARHPDLAGVSEAQKADRFAAAYNGRDIQDISVDWYRDLPGFSGESLLHWRQSLALADNQAMADVTTGHAADGTFAAEYALVPIYQVEVSAGYGATVETETSVARLAFRRDWLEEIGVYESKAATVVASGDSMEPTIHDGDVLLVDTDQRQVIKDAIYVVRQESLLYVKRLQRLYDGSIRISSDNKAYASEMVPKRELGSLEVIGRVVWSGGRL